MVKNFRLLKNAKYSELFGKFGRLAFNPIRGSGMTKGGSVRDRSVTMMLLAIVGIFLCCNCLAFCNNIYEIVRDTRAHIESNVTHIEPSKSNQDVFDFSVELSNILISLNSSSSAFVYLVFSSKYRSIVKHWLGLERRKKINGVAITAAMVAQRALELSFLPDEAGAEERGRTDNSLQNNDCQKGPLKVNQTEASYQNQDVFDFSVELSNILISLNSSSSAFVYLVFSSKYRSIVKHWLGLERRKKVGRI
ncbi:hypothetical protein OSTOST_10897, partial [Ostertagia ostertagi]